MIHAPPHGHAPRNPESAAGTSPPSPKRLPFARRPSVPVRESATKSVDHPTDTPAETHNPPRDKPTQSEATPICTSFIRVFVVFIRGRLSPTDTPAETQTRRRDNPTHPEATPICTSSIRRRFVVFHSWTIFPHGHAHRNSESAPSGTAIKLG